MAYGISTRRDAEIQLLEALELMHLEDADDIYDVDAILEACHEIAGAWNITYVDDDAFWGIVRDNERIRTEA